MSDLRVREEETTSRDGCIGEKLKGALCICDGMDVNFVDFDEPCPLEARTPSRDAGTGSARRHEARKIRPSRE